ncbi:MAG: CaiB/BaiF CoA-transferase family protein [Acidocella sp.]|nr:CaiB/BaiF CoA-transferase family protein [Acidocella sp.]
MPGPLTGIRILEFAAIGPGPFCAMLLADMGADILRIDRPAPALAPADISARGRASLALDLKDPSAIATCLGIIAHVDVLIEGFRPGVMERLGLGPDAALTINPRLIYGRMTGWGQSGPRAHTAGHDINYIALSGALDAIGDAAAPVPPLNLVGDYGGGSLYLAMGIAAALYERTISGQGQVIDAAIIDGAASLMSVFHNPAAFGLASATRGAHMLSGSAPFYGVYRCVDGNFISVGAIEPQFYALFLRILGLAPDALGGQHHRPDWPASRARLAALFATRTRDEWAALFAGTDACVAPVLTLAEAAADRHIQARETLVPEAGYSRPAPAPRFSRSQSEAKTGYAKTDEGGAALLARWGIATGPDAANISAAPSGSPHPA